MPTFEVLNERFRCCKADKICRVEIAPYTGLWWAVLDIPRRWCINGGYGKLRPLKSLDDHGERLTNLTRKTEALSG